MKKNIEIIQKFFEGPFDQTSIAKYDAMLTQDIVLHGPTAGQEEHGLDRLKELDLELASSCNVIKRIINEIFALDDRVIVYWTVYALSDLGENKSEPLVVSGHGIYRIREDKICEIWQSWDKLSFLDQLSQNNIHLNHNNSQPDLAFLKTLGMETYYKKALLLSNRERECLKLLIQGKTAKESAKILALSYRTIEYYLENIKNKLDCSCKRDLLATAQILEKLALLSGKKQKIFNRIYFK